MPTVVMIAGVAIGLLVVVDVFETIVLPRRVASRIRLTRIFYRSTWAPWAAIARSIRDRKRREAFLSIFGPLSVLLLLVVWAVGLILAFALAHWAGGGLREPFANELLTSSMSLVDLGGAVQHGVLTPFVAAFESGCGLALLALVITYLPVVYQGFSRREANITLLDARAGSPPTAAELMLRYGSSGDLAQLEPLLRDWEHWAAELLESHISYPVLGYFRSQHDNQSWLGAMTAVLDSSALCVSGVDNVAPLQAQLTFAMARHTIVDLAKIFNVPPCPTCVDRLPAATDERLRAVLADARIEMRDDEAARQKLYDLRRMYEPYIDALSRYLLMDLPPFVADRKTPANWQTSKWERSGAMH
jgi:hypothetical protein